MVGKRCLTKPTLGVIAEKSGATVKILSPGTIVEILVAPPDENRTVDVNWDGKKVMMFVNDLKDRSRYLLNGPGASPWCPQRMSNDLDGPGLPQFRTTGCRFLRLIESDSQGA